MSVKLIAHLFLATLFTATAFAQAPATSPDWELKDVNGKTVKSSDFKGKVVILDFWATWCPPCVKGIPEFIELQNEFGSKGLVVVGISLDQDGPAVVKAFMEKMKVNYPMVMGDESVVAAFGGVEGIPTTFIIDKEGKIRGKHVGYTAKSQFEADIKPLL